jgi:mRNA interferase MazF
MGRGVLTVVPITSNVERIYPFQVLLPSGTGGLPYDSKAQAEQVRSVDTERVGASLGNLPRQLMTSLENALRLHLAL